MEGHYGVLIRDSSFIFAREKLQQWNQEAQLHICNVCEHLHLPAQDLYLRTRHRSRFSHVKASLAPIFSMFSCFTSLLGPNQLARTTTSISMLDIALMSAEIRVS